MDLPVIFQLDASSGEATGTLAPFCCNACREAARAEIGFSRMVDGTTQLSDFGYIPHCEQCGAEICGIRGGSLDKHDWCIGIECEDGFPVYVDDRQLGYRRTPAAATEYALDVIARLRADGDYRLNDKPAGFMPPALSN
ncbi:hypothetical protein [Burkholderia cenocepacia]|uniref:hypothetical protein n=1 Tax=Burkholderia cenocepacia TaxID=95486 RepID=UPI00076CE2EF|nr:hypothetical protein [Burkholderia cenocepacia]KWU26353.1 hypothetical protein AS149_25525 [Burkholderia cenocepacia]